MNRFMLAVGAVAVVLSVLVGWLAAPLWVSDDQLHVRSSPHVPALERPGKITLTAAEGLLADHKPPPPPPQPQAPKPPPKPPPPDVAVILAGEVSAIIADPRTGKLSLILQVRTPQRRTQILRVGDHFMDGWRLARLTRRYAWLSRRGESRRVSFY